VLFGKSGKYGRGSILLPARAVARCVLFLNSS
jgi:hypothetical protein